MAKYKIIAGTGFSAVLDFTTEGMDAYDERRRSGPLSGCRRYIIVPIFPLLDRAAEI